MRQNQKVSGGGLLLAGLAAFAYYKYSKMDQDQKDKLFGDLKEKGKKLYNDYVPQEVKDIISKKSNAVNNTTNSFS